MVESYINTQGEPNPENQDVHFYSKSSGFKVMSEVKTSSKQTNHLGLPLHYPLHIEQSYNFTTELVTANTDYSV